MSIPYDIREFLDDYPGFEDDPSQSDNLLFYENKLRCRPDRKLIDEIHEEYEKLHIEGSEVECSLCA